MDVVVHAAGMNAQECAADSIAALEFNGVATARLLEAAIRSGVERFIYLSTAHVYASPLSGMITENVCPRNMHPYATSHLAGENAVLCERQRARIGGIVLRLSNTFGAPMHKDVNCWSLLVNDLCRQAILERKLVLRSAGLQRRDFVTLEDVGAAVLHILHLSNDEVDDGIFNLGGAWAPKVIEIAQMVQARCSSMLGFVPEIICPAPSEGEVSLALDFRIDKLHSTGFNLSANISAEIDATLFRCRQFFGIDA